MVPCIESIGEILKCDYSNESSETVLSCGVVHHAREGANLVSVNHYYYYFDLNVISYQGRLARNICISLIFLAVLTQLSFSQIYMFRFWAQVFWPIMKHHNLTSPQQDMCKNGCFKEWLHYCSSALLCIMTSRGHMSKKLLLWEFDDHFGLCN